MKQTTTNWLASADYDLETAGAMLKSRRCLYVVFMCHLALEKPSKQSTLTSKEKAHLEPMTCSFSFGDWNWLFRRHTWS